MTRRLMTAQEAADFLGVHPNILKRLKLPHYTIGARHDHRYDLRDLQVYLAEHWTPGELVEGWGR
jgi:hypothetical protein